MWAKILKTYPDAQIENIWNALLEMSSIFHEIGLVVAEKQGLKYNLAEANNVKAYLLEMEPSIFQ